MDDPYLNDLRGEFNSYSSQLKKLNKKLVKTNSTEEQLEIVEQIDLLANRMETVSYTHLTLPTIYSV